MYVDPIGIFLAFFGCIFEFSLALIAFWEICGFFFLLLNYT